MMALPIGPNQLCDINARKAVFFATNFQGFIDNQGGSVAGTLIDSLLKTTTIDYAPTTGNIHDPSFNILGNSAAALHYMSLLQTSNPALYTRMTTTGIRMLCYPNNNTAYASMVTSLAAIGVPLTVEYKTKNEVFYNPPISQGTDAGALFQDPRYDIIVSGWGSYTLLNHVEFLMYPGQITTNYMGNMMRPGAGGVIGATPNDPVYQTMLDKIDAAHAATTLADKYLRTQEAVQICMDNCYIIFPFNTNTWMSWGSFTKNSKLEVTGLGPNFRDTVYNS